MLPVNKTKPSDCKYKELLIDGDMVVFSSCAAVEYGVDTDAIDEQHRQDAFNVSVSRINNMRKRLRAEKVRVFFSHDFNFRSVINPTYKMNRKDVWRPSTLKATKKAITDLFGAECEMGLEADDLLALNQKDDGTTVIATLDKDLLQVPGVHYHWETQHKGEEVILVDKFGTLAIKDGKKQKVWGCGAKFFCYQLLIGDPTDGVLGCAKYVDAVYQTGPKKGQAYTRRHGVGSLTAYDLLENCHDYKSCMQVVIAQYKKHCGETWEEDLLRNGRSLYMARKIEGNMMKLWDFRNRETWFDLEAGEISLRG